MWAGRSKFRIVRAGSKSLARRFSELCWHCSEFSDARSLPETMKVVKKTNNGETRELLLKEYFLNAYLIAMLKRLGEEVGRRSDKPERLVEARVPVR